MMMLGTVRGSSAVEIRSDFDPDQPRDETGKWTDTGGGASASGWKPRDVPQSDEPWGGYGAAASRASSSPVSRNIAPAKNSGAYRPKDVHDAVRALHEGRKIEFEQPHEVSTLLDRLAEIANEAKAKGEKAPTYNLCNVSVAGSNLFCADTKGVPRIKMPQLAAKPLPGSKADRLLQKDSKGEVNLGEHFRAHLAAKGIRIDDTQERADYLRASQNELHGGKVGGMMKAIEAGKLKPAPIFVSRDNYVIDGHHRWAANVGVDMRDSEPGDILMPVARIDMPILEALDEANKFAADWGIPQASVGEPSGGSAGEREKPKPVQYAGYDSAFIQNELVVINMDEWSEELHPRDEAGKFAESGGAVTGGSAGAQSSSSPAMDTGHTGPRSVASVARAHAERHGRTPPVHRVHGISPEEGRTIADHYDAATPTPNEPETKAAYSAFRDEVKEQYDDLIAAGYTIEPWEKPGQPYNNSKDMREDVLQNKHIYFFKSTASESTPVHPLMPLEDNDRFRAVHDVFGHALHGNQFGPKGETTAFLDHRQMFSDDASRAMATETLGQNAWFNFSRANEGKGITERTFAEQKAFLIDPKLYAPLVERAEKTEPPKPKEEKHDAADDDGDEADNYGSCPCHRPS